MANLELLVPKNVAGCRILRPYQGHPALRDALSILYLARGDSGVDRP